ncbi:unnamed protein product [Rangifer tarandus platyrhynchus]|uniref:Uncharacterized protein n=2 Tax=Rangifer tarandus platyrhynchus TaxID=3082113 RepID=A0ABN8XT92_RANTA|nr:unnamed protein product [Rangifer tarandus platyrhynchus]
MLTFYAEARGENCVKSAMPPQGHMTLECDACHPEAEGGGPLAPRQSEAHTQREAQLRVEREQRDTTSLKPLDPAKPAAHWSLSSPSSEQILFLLSRYRLYVYYLQPREHRPLIF